MINMQGTVGLLNMKGFVTAVHAQRHGVSEELVVLMMKGKEEEMNEKGSAKKTGGHQVVLPHSSARWL